ncbi:MAG: transcription termination/antitermination NusG family protein [Rhizobiales bacterium]|nr:transcription termination/antitermination NusG family protein [Hyphomicrobiales bacterium]
MKPLSDAFSPEVMAALAKPFEPRDPQIAEIIPGTDPRWYAVEVFASAQADVAAELVKHRFGIYIPEVDETVVKRGRKFDRRVPLFSGYIFVFMWPSIQHWRWVADTPGIIAIVGSLTDAEIDIVRRVENQKRPIVIEVPDAEPEPDPEPVRGKSKKKRRWKGRRKTAKRPARKPITEADLRAEIITTRAWSAFDDLLDLDSEGRNQTLMRALGLS